MLVKLGGTIHLNLQLDDGATDQFPQAILRDQTGAQIGSPISLTHTGNGYYQDDSAVMPNTDEVTATFIVYEDAAHTTLSCYGISDDVYTLDRTLSIVENIQSSLANLVSSSLPGDSILGLIQDDSVLEGLILDQSVDSLVGIIDDRYSLQGSILEPELLEGYILSEDPPSLIGFIDC